MLCECGNESRARWNQEKREREGCLDSQLDWNLNSDAYIREEQVYI